MRTKYKSTYPRSCGLCLFYPAFGKSPVDPWTLSEFVGVILWVAITSIVTDNVSL